MTSDVEARAARAGQAALTPEPPAPEADRLVLTTGLIIALCIVGDSYLYSVLPLEAANLGIALPLVGVLLSANRLVRLVSNTWAGAVFERWGPKRPFAGSTLLALATTAAYAFGRGFLVFLPARLGWGIAWSALRQGGYQAVWAGGPTQRGRLMGLLWGIIRLGSAAGVVVGGYLRDRFGYQAGVLAITGITLLAVPLASALRWPAEAHRPQEPGEPGTPNVSFWRSLAVALRLRLGCRLLGAGFVYAVVEGVLISTASLVLAQRLGDSEVLRQGLGIRVATVAGLVLAVRWTSDILVGPAIGALADRLQPPRAAVLLALTLLTGVVGVTQAAGLALVACLAVVFVSSSGLNVTLSAIANGLALAAERPHLFVGAYTTAADAGSALGPLLAYSAGIAFGMDRLYVVAGSALLAAAVWYWLAWRKTVTRSSKLKGVKS